MKIYREKLKVARGRSGGRPRGPSKSRLDPFRTEIEELLSNGSPLSFIAKRYGFSYTGLSSWMKKNSIFKGE
jgi:transposase